MGRHTKRERTDDEPVPAEPAPTGPFYGAPPAPSFDAFSGPTDDQVFVSYEPFQPAPSPAGPPPAERQHGPPERHRFEPYPGDYASGLPTSMAGSMAGGDERVRDERVRDDRVPADPPPPDADDPAEPPSTRARVAKLVSALPVPMLPIVALVVAVGVVAYALSTQQISLNFAGGAPKHPINNPRDSQVSQRGPGERAGRANRPDGLVIAFHVTSRSRTGFEATATIANKGNEPVARWALAFKIPNVTIGAIKGVTVVKTGRLAYVRGTALAPGRSTRFAFAGRGTPKKPTYCVMNRLACTIL